MLINKTVWFIKHKYNNTNYQIVKMKPIDVKSSTYIDLDIENNDKEPNFWEPDNAIISKHKNIFAKCYNFTLNWSEEIFVIKKIKNIVPWTYGMEDPNGEEIVASFCEK